MTFDTVCRNALFVKLPKIRNIYNDVSFVVNCHGKATNSFKSTVGVKQGCNLSPLLFSLFLYDLPITLSSSPNQVYINNENISCLLYADDLVIISETDLGLQSSINALANYCDKWCLTVNINKTKIMIFNSSGKLMNRSFYYKNHHLEIVKEYCYLGIIFTPSGSFSTAIKALCQKASKVYFMIRRDIRDSNCVVALKLFTSLVLPILSYACEVWSPFLLRKLKNGNLFSIASSFIGEALHVKLCKTI